MPIKILNPNVVAKIAAGEVVERPASVVKELVENSLDAGATQISVETQGGGLNMIRVIDNGAGIPSEELELALCRYATSKINDFTDLESINNLGFRGEALSSIAAVAHVNILARSEQEERGNHVAAEDGKVVRRKSEGRSIGTTITVRNLFRKVPARLKFLKSTTTENSHIANTVSQYALGFPEIRFTLVIDGRATLRTAGNNRLLDTIAQIHGSGVAQHMLEVRSGEEEWKNDGNEISVTGMISSPSISRSNRNHLSFFVNRRWISSRLLSWAVEQAYHGLLMTGRHPMAVINISTAPTEVDVNIHPTKTEVKFRNDHQIFVSVQKSVRRSLIEQAPTPEMKDSTKSYTSSLASRQPAWMMPEKNETPIFNVPEASQVTQHAPLLLRVFGQLASSYIVAEGPDGLYLIDQHAAHERIIYGQLKKRHSKIEVQGLLEPTTFEVDPKKEEILRSHYQELKELGFLIEPFGERTYLLRALPVCLMDKDWPTMLREALESFDGGNHENWMESVTTSIACHGAVRAGQTLTDEEIRELILQLEQADVSMTCPHGRPTMIKLSLEQLAKEFGR